MSSKSEPFEVVILDRFSESGYMGSKESSTTVTLASHSATELKMTIEKSNDDFLAKPPLHDSSKEEFVINIESLINLVRKNYPTRT